MISPAFCSQTLRLIASQCWVENTPSVHQYRVSVIIIIIIIITITYLLK